MLHPSHRLRRWIWATPPGRARGLTALRHKIGVEFDPRTDIGKGYRDVVRGGLDPSDAPSTSTIQAWGVSAGAAPSPAEAP
jgi:hypothetical protein